MVLRRDDKMNAKDKKNAEMQKKCRKICVCQKKAVPLHPIS